MIPPVYAKESDSFQKRSFYRPSYRLYLLKKMKLELESTILPANVDFQNFSTRVQSIAFTSDGKYIAIALNDRVKIIDSSSHHLLDRLATKSDYITCISFQPEASNESCKLAVGHADGNLLSFKFALRNANDSLFRNNKKTLVNKFEETSPIFQIIWNTPTEIIYGLKSGVLKVGNLRSNVAQTLYSVDSQLVGLSMSKNYLISAHSNGEIQKYSFGTILQEPSVSKHLQLQAKILCVEAAESLAIGLCDEKCGLRFFDDEGEMEVVDVNKSTETNQTITAISKSPNGKTIAVGYYDRFHLYHRNNANNSWTNSKIVKVENMMAVSSFGWNPSGSQLLVGSSSGLLNVYSTKKRSYNLHDEFQITHVSLTDVVIKRCNQTLGRDYHITSTNGEEILDVDIISSLNSPILRYVVARTNSSLILSDLNEESKSSQFDFTRTGEGEIGKSIYIEEDSTFCLAHHKNKVHIVEVGSTKLT